MPSIQIRNMPRELYEALAERARRERRSLAQQAIVDLSTIDELQSPKRRESVISELRSRRVEERSTLSDPVRIVREDRER
jgi:hypothetical protein